MGEVGGCWGEGEVMGDYGRLGGRRKMGMGGYRGIMGGYGSLWEVMGCWGDGGIMGEGNWGMLGDIGGRDGEIWGDMGRGMEDDGG